VFSGIQAKPGIQAAPLSLPGNVDMTHDLSNGHAECHEALSARIPAKDCGQHLVLSATSEVLP
jgi:hypothetical protein